MERHVGVWVYDEHGRRAAEVDYRLLDGDRLLTRLTRVWDYTGPQAPEFDEEASRTTVTLGLGGRGRVSHEPRGSKGPRRDTGAHVPEEQRWMDRPAFGEWPVFSAQAHGLTGPVILRAAGSDGVHPVWVGRSAHGDVVGVVVLVDGMPGLLEP
ncbi:hypothetical protein [Streptomyces sp. NBC_01233]|uniref:hypothetical protein n=1 Tax=Streptomyces sp. NBC_01233 TaxID=2903787 RepID=UPI002E10ED1F|nr:hypothetical protein OG332_18645 [Streptomyces sp. NBC_01233]